MSELPRTPKKKYQRTIFLPNSSPVPNWFFDDVLSNTEIPHAARSIFLFLLRKTIGWDRRSEYLSLSQIQDGAAVTRHTAIHALRVICDCWGLFRKTRGQRGQHSSEYLIGDLTADDFIERCVLIEEAYGTVFPSPEQLRAKPCTKEVLDQARAGVQRDRDGQVGDRRIASSSEISAPQR